MCFYNLYAEEVLVVVVTERLPLCGEFSCPIRSKPNIPSYWTSTYQAISKNVQIPSEWIVTLTSIQEVNDNSIRVKQKSTCWVL